MKFQDVYKAVMGLSDSWRVSRKIRTEGIWGGETPWRETRIVGRGVEISNSRVRVTIEDMEGRVPPLVIIERYSNDYCWFEKGRFNDDLINMGFKIRKGKWHNYVDGGVHYFYVHEETGLRYELKANYWDNTSFLEFVDWLVDNSLWVEDKVSKLTKGEK